MFYTVYKITNIKNGKIYVGVHKTHDLNDDYMGSGLNIKRAIKKYGIQNFKKDFIKVCDNERDMFDMESQLVNDSFLKRNDVYNITRGGNGGWNYTNSIVDKETKRKNALRASKSVPLSIKQKVGMVLGNTYGGKNKLSYVVIQERLNLLDTIDMMKYGWIQKATMVLGCTHAQVRRFVHLHYKKEYYKRKRSSIPRV